MYFVAPRIYFVALLILASCHSDAAVGQNVVEADSFRQAAPEKCVAYIAWDASAEKRIEGNSTQALMAEPEVRRFVEDLQVRAGLIMPAALTGSSMPKLKTELLHWISPRVAESVFQRSGCIFVESIEVPRGNPQQLDIKAAMMLDIGKDAERFVNRMAAYTKKKGEPSTKVKLAGTEAYRVEIQEVPFALYFGNSGSVVVMALGESAYSGAIERMRGEKIPAWLTSLQQKSQKLSHVHSLGYIDSKAILRAVRKIAGPNANVVAELLGVSNIAKVEMIGGLNEKNSSLHFLIDTKQPEGILGLVAKNPINEEMFEDLPADALSAYALTIEAQEVLNLIDATETLLGGGMGFGQFKDAVQRETGVDFEQDLLQNTGKNWLWYCGASDGWYAGTTVVGETKDAGKVAESIELFFQKLAESTRQVPDYYRPKLFKQIVGEQTIFSIQARDFVVEPSICVTGDRVYIAMFPQAIRTAIQELPSDEILFDSMQLTKFRKSRFLGDTAQVTGLAYHDTKNQLKIIYPLAQFYKANFNMFMGLGRTRDPNVAALIDGFQLPPARSVIRHIEPSLAVIRTGDEGVEIEIKQTIPTNGVAVALPTAVGMLLPALGQLRSSASTVQSANNLKQIALASLNHESAHMRFPYDGPQANKDEHRFSWRVHILPYIEQQNLYDQFRFDEPWDSEHNKTLIAQMPAIYKAPSSNAKAGWTVYRGFGGEQGILGQQEDGTTFGQITDGSSNTILVLEVDDEHASPWTKPEGLSTDAEEVKKLFGDRNSAMAVFSDGHTQTIPADTAEDDLQHLVERSDGNVIELLNQPVRQRRDQSGAPADPRFLTPGVKEPIQ